MYAPRAVRPHRPHIPALLELLLALTLVVLLLAAIPHIMDYRDHVADIQARAQQMAISAGWMALPVTPTARDTWYAEMAPSAVSVLPDARAFELQMNRLRALNEVMAPSAVSYQPFVRDSWYAEARPIASGQPFARDSWYAEMAVPSSMSRPYVHDAWYAEVASPALTPAEWQAKAEQAVEHAVSAHEAAIAAASAELPSRVTGQQTGPY